MAVKTQVRTRPAPLTGAAPSHLFEARTTHQGAATCTPLIVYDVLRSPGQPLDAETRAFFEPRFGHDFGGVRIHADARAAQSAQAVMALAYAAGPQLVFAEGQYAPKTSAGRQLLAHELTHVLQQNFSVSSGLTIGQPDDAYERSAESTAQEVMEGRKPSNAAVNLPHMAGSRIQRQQAGGTSKTRFKPVEGDEAEKELKKKAAAYKSKGKTEVQAYDLAMDDMFAERVEATGGRRFPKTVTPSTPGTKTYLQIPGNFKHAGDSIKEGFYSAAIDDVAYNCHSYTFYDARQTKLAKLNGLAKIIPKEGEDLAGQKYFDAEDLDKNGIHFETINKDGIPILPIILPRWVLADEVRSQLKNYKALAEGKVAKQDAAVYSANEDLPHSGKVTEVDAKGHPTKLKSKWGHYSLFEHAPDAVPAYYGIPSYYRKK